MDPDPGMEVYDPCYGSAGLLIKCQLTLEKKMSLRSKTKYAPLTLYGQEYVPETWAMANRTWKEEDTFSRIVGWEEIAKNDYTISLSRYIHTADGEEYRPIAEIVEELNALEEEARETDRALNMDSERLPRSLLRG